MARAALSCLIEPGDRVAGRWVREYGPEVVAWDLTRSQKQPPYAEGRRVGSPRARERARDPGRELERIQRAGGRFVCPGDSEWPTQLDDLGDARPLGLWVRGRPDLRLWALRSVAVVGARACTEYGSHVAATLSAALARAGWIVASGAAYGIDAAAHRGALAAQGATLGVLACGVDRAYPSGNAELIDRLAQQGLLVAELPLGEHPTRSRFIMRNRVLAALTRGTVVVEAALRSGSLSTARQARDLGRITMGVPGPVTSAVSAGVHELLRTGAEVVTEAAQVVELVGRIGADLAPAHRVPLTPRDRLPRGAVQVLEVLPGRGTVDSTWIARESGTERDEALGRLYELLSLGFVERQGDRWRLSTPPAEHPIRW
ncbi:DNA-processing protein DprA [Streptomyces polyrhachis]|uniref:DNA-processing protein DprA n=1 Tax=Streptomyces polyrhachis TaxID=1282885 RepID=A0ABW2GFB7_9ACTN